MIYDVDEFLVAVYNEVFKAVEKFPQPNPTLAALMEETGEVAKALLHIREKKTTGWDDVYDEAVQTAAMACRIAIEGDQVLGITPEKFNQKD